MQNIIKAIQDMKNISNNPYDSFPDLELYMDQILLCLSRQQPNERDEEKITSAMVNNYIKAGLMPRANGKKYNREHLAYLTIISKLKQVLTMADCKTLLKEANLNKNIEEYYSDYNLNLTNAFDALIEGFENTDEKELCDIALNLALESYVNKLACEYVIDILNKKNESDNLKEKKEDKKGVKE